MDFLSGGELFYHLKKRGLILEKEVLFYLAEMVLAIEFLHQQGIIHRDLKPENVLLRGDGHVAITDFGLAKEIGDGSVCRTLCGTSEYMAPEMLTRNGYGKAVDWWALGALCFEMLSGGPPFQGKTQKELDRKILSDKFIAPSYLHKHTHSLLRGLLEKDSTKRLGCVKSNMFSIGGVSALKQHVFFESLDWLQVLHRKVSPPIDLQQQGQGHIIPSNPSQQSQQLGAKTMSLDKSIDVSLVSHFDQDFTNRAISPSILEDVYSHCTSPDNERDEDFEGFEYTDRSFAFTEQQVSEFHTLLNLKIQKANKKRLLKNKKEEKLAQEEASRKIIEEEMNEKKRLEEKEMNEKKRLEEEQQQQIRIRKQEMIRIESHNSSVLFHREELLRCQRKVKACRKKLRDVKELEEKTSLTTEQMMKLSRKELLLTEEKELEEEEKQLLATCPGDLIVMSSSSSSSDGQVMDKEQQPPIITTAIVVDTIITTIPTMAMVNKKEQQQQSIEINKEEKKKEEVWNNVSKKKNNKKN